jgi:hypothetical protein
MISTMLAGVACSSSAAAAPKAQRKHRQPAEPEGKGQRRRADEHILGRDAEHFRA